MTAAAKMKIGFAGLSHLGTTASICSAGLGCEVTACDGDASSIADFKAGKLHIHEPDLPQRLAAAQGSIHFTDCVEDLGGCDLVIVCLDTVTDAQNRSDLGPLKALISLVAPQLKKGTALASMSQVPAGFSRETLAAIRTLPQGGSLTYYYWVETLVIGNAVQRFLAPERLITGSADGEPPTGALGEYLAKFRAPIVSMNYESAELTKTAINLYLSSSVCFANFISDLCEKYGASMKQVAAALKLDKRIGPAAYIRPGLGIAGGNLERDLVHLRDLADQAAVPSRYVGTMLELNQGRYRWAITQIEERMRGEKPDAKIAFLGIAYKKDTQSVKNSFAVRVMSELKGRFRMSAYDPRAALPEELRGPVTQESLEEALRGAVLAVLITDWDEFSGVVTENTRALMKRPVLIDCCAIIDPRAGDAAGIAVSVMGEGAGRL